MAQKDVGNKVPIYKLKKTDEVMKYYDEWGEDNKYDQDMIDWNYTGPKESSEVFDPLEGYNRTMHGFNDWFYINVGFPLARGYRWVVPEGGGGPNYSAM